MHKIYSIVVTLIFGYGAAKASTPLDSIGVENYKGNKLILHKVDPKDTYYSIARRYGVNYKDVMTFNESKMLNIGVTVKVPTTKPFVTASTTSGNPAPVNGIFDYTVQKKDNLNAIAERFHTSVDDIKRINKLKGIGLQVGQVLKINGNKGLNTQNEKVNENIVVAPAPVQKPQDGTYEIYTVKKKDNLNLIAKNFNTTADAIKTLNGLRSINLSIGQELKIPSSGTAETTSTATPAAVAATVPQTVPENVTPTQPKTERELRKQREALARAEGKSKDNSENENEVVHIVAPNETIYTIAKKYGVTTYQITTTNKLERNTLKVGQKLNIPNSRPIESFEPVAQNDSEEPTNDSALKTQALRLPAERYGLSQAEEKGTALWISDADLDASKMLVLHRSAPIGKIVKITNPINGRSTFAKVVGKFTENESTKDVIIVMTKAVADAVGALDKRFFCNITYSPQENVQ